MPFALGYPLPHPSKHNSSPVSSRKLPLTCLTQSSIGFLLDHGLVAGREALPYLFGVQTLGRQGLSQSGVGEDLAHVVRYLEDPSSPDLCCQKSVCSIMGWGVGHRPPHPPPPDISKGTESQPIHHTRLHFFIRMEFTPGLEVALSE